MTICCWLQKLSYNTKSSALRPSAAAAAATTTQSLNELADDDIIALPFDGYIASINNDDEPTNNALQQQQQLRLCVVRNNGQIILPLVRHEDDVETDLFLDPRFVDHGDVALVDVLHYWSRQCNDSNNSNNSNKEEDANNNSNSIEKEEVPYYGVGWYGQRPVPSLGGGPGYGAQADEIWSIDEDVLESILLEEEEDNDNNNKVGPYQLLMWAWHMGRRHGVVLYS